MIDYQNQHRFLNRDPIGVGTFPIPAEKYNKQKVQLAFEADRSFFNRDKASLYIHIPFCKQFCHFCGLNRYFAQSSKVDDYVDALIKEIESYSKLNYSKRLKIAAVYFGGGTPTILQQHHIVKLLQLIKSVFSLTDDCEITMEGTFYDFNEELVYTLHKNHVTRLSIGVQTLDDNVRKLIGVRGTSESVIDSLKIVKNYYKNYNVDLIYNLPGQTLESFTADLNTVLGEIDAPHMTINPFVLLRNAQLYKEMERGKIPFPNQELEMEMFHDSLDIIASFGRKHYSVRDFCKPGNECNYILNNAFVMMS